MTKKVKTILISVISVVLVVAIVIGVLWYLGRNNDPVKVLPVSMHSSAYMGNETQSGGYVTADRIQKVYASATQTVTQVLVQQGQEVKKGDPLLSYDTTLSDIQLERKEIAVRQAELELQNAKRELTRINTMKPYVPPAPTEPTTEAPTEPLEPAEELPYRIGGEGTEEKPLRYLTAEGVEFDSDFLETLLADKEAVWIAFEIRTENAVKGELLETWGMKLSRNADTGAIKFAYFAPPEIADDVPEPAPVEPDIPDDSSGYTAAEIAKMRAEQQVKIRDCDLAYRQAQVEYEKMKVEAENGIVTALVDGKVIALNDPETAAQENQPVVTVSGGGCYYVKATLSEFDLQKFTVGTPVRVESWGMNGMVSTEGTIDSVSDTPTSGDDYYGSSNPNASYYNAMIAVDASAELQEGDYVTVYFGDSSQTDGSALYLEAMYVRTEGTRAYVYKRGEDGLLKKTYVSTGEQLWGYIRILSGLSEEDYIAFPYGKNVKDGATTVEDDGSGSDYAINDGVLY